MAKEGRQAAAAAAESAGAALKRRREARGLSQDEVAAALGVSRSAVSHWETDRERPTAEEAAQLEELLGAARADGATLAGWLARARRAKGLTQEELAERTGLDAARVAALEVGKVLHPRRRTVKRLEAELGEAPKKALRRAQARVPGLGAVVEFDPHDPRDRPKGAGLFLLLDAAGRPIHVGHARRARKRLEALAGERWFARPMVDAAAFVEVEEEKEREKLAGLLLALLKTSIVVRTREEE